MVKHSLIFFATILNVLGPTRYKEVSETIMHLIIGFSDFIRWQTTVNPFKRE